MTDTTVWIKPNTMIGNTQPLPAVIVKEHGNASWRSEAVVDVLVLNETMTLPLSLLSDHRPEKVVKVDEYGEVTVWE